MILKFLQIFNGLEILVEYVHLFLIQVLTVMMGGAWFEKYFGKCSSEEHLKMIAIKYVNKLLCINEDPKICNVSILKDCIPQYVIGHAQRLTRIHDYISAHKIPLGLCGSSYHGVGVSHVILHI